MIHASVKAKTETDANFCLMSTFTYQMIYCYGETPTSCALWSRLKKILRFRMGIGNTDSPPQEV